MYLFLLILSCLAFMVLIMPATFYGIILTFIASVFLVIFILRNKSFYIVNFKEPIPYGFSFIILSYASMRFYFTWMQSSKIIEIVKILSISPEVFLAIVSTLLALCSSIFIYILVYKIDQYLVNTASLINLYKIISFSILLSILISILSDAMIGIFLTSKNNIILSTIFLASLILLIYSLCGKFKISLSIMGIFFIAILVVNVYVFKFRGRMFEPMDVYTIHTVMNVAENYSLFPVPYTVIIGLSFFIFVLGVLCLRWIRVKHIISFGRRIILLLCSLVCVSVIFGYSFNLKTHHLGKIGPLTNGYVLDYLSRIQEILITEPENYNENRISELKDRYTTDSNVLTSDGPTIIAIMNESYSNLGILGDMSTNIDVSSFFSSLKDNTISGYTLASVFGGNTSNSEFEFLTGNSMAWLSSSSSPYLQYIHSSSYSMVSYLKLEFDYKCIAMHPFDSSGWNRPNIYKYFGFDEMYFIDDYPQKNFVRNYVSDKEMFDELIRIYENRDEAQPLFLFGVTMQNHGNYDYEGKDFKHTVKPISLDNTYYDVEQYLNLVYETDKALEHLISYFEKVEDDVVILFFGDHQPKLDDNFYKEIMSGDENSLDVIQRKHIVPFFVWANYDIEENNIECTSLNYLSTYLYDVAGIPLPPYNQFLSEMEEVIPSINANGYYSLDKKGYVPLDSASGKEKEYLDTYRILQYNNLHDKEGRNNELFPVLE